MGTTWYSYYDLIRKDAGFDCLSSLACGYKKTTITGNYATNRFTFKTRYFTSFITQFTFTADFYFAPLAEVKSGVFIRGDRLKNYATGAVYNPIEPTNIGAITYSLNLGNNDLLDPATDWRLIGFTRGVEKRAYHNPDKSPLVTLDVDPDSASHVTARVNIELFPRDLANMTGWETWYPNQSVGLNDLDNTPFYSYTLIAEAIPGNWRYEAGIQMYQQDVAIQGIPETSIGNPVSSPLFTIPFN